jgi:hypothetical protein
VNLLRGLRQACPLSGLSNARAQTDAASRASNSGRKLGKEAELRESTSSHAPRRSPMNLTILAVGYRARCTEAGCANLGRLVLRHAHAGGRLMSNSEFCHAHARVKLSRDRAGGLRVYDAASLSEPIPRLAAPQPPVAATHETGARSSKTVKTSYQGSDARARGRCPS